MTSDLIALKDQLVNADLLIFDFDGTLVDLEGLNYSSLKKVVSDHLNEEVDLSMYRDIFAGTKSTVGIEKIFQEISKDRNIDIEGYDYYLLSEEFREHKREALLDSPSKFSKLVGRADTFVPMMKEKGKLISVVSASAKEFIERLLHHYNILSYFDHIVASEDVVLPKPHPEPYEKALSYFKINRRNVVAFEDSRNGIRSAKAAGLYTVGILCKGWNDDYVYDLADVVVDDYSTCIEVLNR